MNRVRAKPFAALLLVGCAPEPPRPPAPAPWFEERAQDLGLHFEHRSGAAGERLMPEIMCGGAALFDGDGDGDLDAYLVQAGAVRGPEAERPPNQLFEYREARFHDVTAGSGADHRGYGNGVACGDLDGDGAVDLYVTNWGPNQMLLNRGGLRFAAQDQAADPGWSTSAACVDVDRDGDLDLFVVNYLEWQPDNELPCVNVQGAPDYCSPLSYESPAQDRLWVNDGRAQFTDRTVEAGLVRVSNGLGVAALDFDGDGLSDLFVANDGMPDHLWHNRTAPGGGPRFEECAARLGVAVDGDGVAKAGMGVAVCDLDLDGHEDLLVGNLARESDSVYLLREGRFDDAGRRLGLAAVSRPFTRFGLGFHDFDNDGWVDLYQANGRVQLGELTRADPFAEEDLLLRGQADGRFVPVEPRGGVAPPLLATGRAAAFGDVDGDGGTDVLVVNRDGPAHLLLNVVPGRGPWIGVELLERSGAPALQALVQFEFDGERRVRRTRAAYSYQASNDPRVLCALPADAGSCSVRVTYSDGTQQDFGALEPGRYHRLRRAP
jgi:hypothetical protein